MQEAVIKWVPVAEGLPIKLTHNDKYLVTMRRNDVVCIDGQALRFMASIGHAVAYASLPAPYQPTEKEATNA